ncbi:MAG: DUF4105 domain-containing protein [Thermodesulfobacteriota bacterium]
MMIRNLPRLLARALMTLPLLPTVAWAAAALWFDGPRARWAAGALSASFVLVCLALLCRLRPYRRALLAVLLAFAAVLGWWLTIPPGNDRDWQPEVARTATVSLEGNLLTVHNLRNFDYRSETDFTEHWESRAYDLEQLQGVDIFLCFWGPTAIAHTIASWEFGDGSHLAISIETRKEKGESYSAVRGFFRQFEVYYVVADERDVVRLRTNYRGEQVYLYRIRMSPPEARALLLDYVAEINRLARHPRWYNALTHNCTTAIRYHLKHLQRAQQFDWRILANGRVDELMYERGVLSTRLPLAELRRRSDITARAKAAAGDAAFSARIREGMPDRPTAAESR